mmetsp:Transcript_41486/g.100735  ORF Transcript_41486/g.100735 Transcript_41486/m.100735 type:complete len:205 (-) Transcript_41486:22-636(-)
MGRLRHQARQAVELVRLVVHARLAAHRPERKSPARRHPRTMQGQRRELPRPLGRAAVCVGRAAVCGGGCLERRMLVWHHAAEGRLARARGVAQRRGQLQPVRRALRAPHDLQRVAGELDHVAPVIRDAGDEKLEVAVDVLVEQLRPLAAVVLVQLLTQRSEPRDIHKPDSRKERIMLRLSGRLRLLLRGVAEHDLRGRVRREQA